MRYFFCLFFLLSFNIFAQSQLTLKQQTEIVENIAKIERRELWISGNREVSSSVTKMSAKAVRLAIKDDYDSVEPLNKLQVEEIYDCQKSSQFCSVYIIDISATKSSGLKKARVWVMLNILDGKYESLSQILYLE
jgi:hypothetical protein